MISTAQNTNYRIYSASQHKEVSLTDIVEDMNGNDVLFFGEEHNDSTAHYLQSTIFSMLFERYGSSMALSLEMFDRDVQLVMNEYLTDAIRERNFVKDARAWNNYADYRPLVELAKAHQLPVICANAPSRYTNLAGRKGQQALQSLSKEAKQFFAPLSYPIASGTYYEKLMGVMGHDPSKSDTAAKKPAAMPAGEFDFIAAQSLWDATMAYSLAIFLKKNKGKKIFQVNGRFHSDEKFAIVTQLQQYRPGTKMLVISAGPDESFPNIDWSKFEHLGDYVIITNPAVSESF